MVILFIPPSTVKTRREKDDENDGLSGCNRHSDICSDIVCHLNRIDRHMVDFVFPVVFPVQLNCMLDGSFRG